MDALVVLVSEGQEPHRRQSSIMFPETELVGGDLLEDKLVVRDVLIERIDDVVTVGVGESVSLLATVDRPFRIGVPCYIQPVPPPSLAVLLSRQQVIDKARKSGGRRIRHERHDFVVTRRQADEQGDTGDRS